MNFSAHPHTCTYQVLENKLNDYWEIVLNRLFAVWNKLLQDRAERLQFGLNLLLQNIIKKNKTLSEIYHFGIHCTCTCSWSSHSMYMYIMFFEATQMLTMKYNETRHQTNKTKKKKTMKYRSSKNKEIHQEIQKWLNGKEVDVCSCFSNYSLNLKFYSIQKRKYSDNQHKVA